MNLKKIVLMMKTNTRIDDLGCYYMVSYSSQILNFDIVLAKAFLCFNRQLRLNNTNKITESIKMPGSNYPAFYILWDMIFII